MAKIATQLTFLKIASKTVEERISLRARIYKNMLRRPGDRDTKYLRHGTGNVRTEEGHTGCNTVTLSRYGV